MSSSRCHANVATQMLPRKCCHANVATQMLPRRAKCCHAIVATQMLPRNCCHANVHANVATQLLPRKCCHAIVATQLLPRNCCHPRRSSPRRVIAPRLYPHRPAHTTSAGRRSSSSLPTSILTGVLTVLAHPWAVRSVRLWGPGALQRLGPGGLQGLQRL